MTVPATQAGARCGNVVRVSGLPPNRCTLTEGHAGQHAFAYPRIATAGSAPVSAPVPPRSSGKHDPAARRRAQRRGRERGCWVYIAADGLAAAGYAATDPAPFYRVWGGARGRFVVVLYPEP